MDIAKRAHRVAVVIGSGGLNRDIIFCQLPDIFLLDRVGLYQSNRAYLEFN